MGSFLLAVALMVAVVGPLLGWVVWADRRRRQDGSELHRNEEVA